MLSNNKKSLTWLWSGHDGIALLIQTPVLVWLAHILQRPMNTHRVDIRVQLIGVHLVVVADAGSIGARYFDRRLLQVNLFAVRVLHVVVHALVVAQTAVVIQRHELLFPVLVDGAVCLLVQEALLDWNGPADAHVIQLVLFVFLFVGLGKRETGWNEIMFETQKDLREFEMKRKFLFYDFSLRG